MNSGYAPVNGLRMYYETHGHGGTGRPLVLLHGGLQTIELSFGPVLGQLAAGRQVIATELQGHGRTADIERDLEPGLLAGDSSRRAPVQVHALIPGAQLAVLPGATHAGVLRRPTSSCPLVNEFLR